ncbi:tRNA guanosine(34) transglycosylase Tgt [Sediminispirochaeta bajacaliforniensis]|uniref:tRNA guanosine(34) transglycosylase Tgt n=1 Tax=Sediminispirochaeta bajacaliforniensis TaxID=148 RepID=UPI000380608A|nr:tRNA guanosine(34) transglycosylase Tgt [Sediminispirochaeta bajacaliforniensis]
MLTIDHNDTLTAARTGTLALPHGTIEVPAFMPVGTNGTVKAISHAAVDNMGYRLILGNTYHLYLRPGKEVFETYGGLHAFSSWPHNILTDSGGFQVFSLAPFRKIRDEGVRFRSHIDGSYHHLTPESVVEFQRTLGSDIMMCLDECTPPEISYKKAIEACRRTTAWAKRSKARWDIEREAGFEGKLFGIIQGNFFKDLRKISSEEIIELDFPGIAIGGLSVGEPKETFEEYLAYTSQFLPPEKPRYLMGIGTPDYIFAAVENGIDLFDCVFATRTARNGTVFTKDGMINLKKAGHALDKGPIEEGCTCQACTRYSRGYMRHLFKAGELFGPMLATEHNLQFLYDLMVEIRHSIREDRFSSFKKDFLDRYLKKGN